MPKPPKKSSATKATQKKKAGKKGGPDGASEGAGGPSKKSLKGLSKAEKKALKNGPKVYIPPPKPPAPALPDPLDVQGLARTLPSELVVLLRRLGKKDATTRRKGLDEFRAEWVEPAAGEVRNAPEFAGGSRKVDILVETLPVWMHHLPSLLLSPSHRSLALTIHSKLFSIPILRSAIVDGLNLGLFTAPHQIRDVLGAWLVSALEEGRRGAGSIGSEGLDLWREVADWSPSEQVAIDGIDMRSQLELLVEYLSLAILEPQQLHEEIHPPQVQADASGASTPRKGGKGPAPLPAFPSLPSKEVEDEHDAAQAEEIVLPYRSSGLAGLDYILQEMPLDMEIPESLANLLHKSEFWSLISPDGSTNSNGPIRRGLYSILRTLIRRREQWVGERIVPVAAPIIMKSAWREADATVWAGGVLGETLALWLTKFRQVWLMPTRVDAGGNENDADTDADSDDDIDESGSDTEEEGEPASGAATERTAVPADSAKASRTLGQESYEAFLTFLQRGCNGQAVEAYPIVLVILSTIPSEILPLERDALQRLFTSFWAPVEAKLLAHHGQGATPSPFMAFTAAVVDCVVYLAAKAWRHASEESTVQLISKEDASGFVASEFGKVWQDGVLLPASRTRGRGGATEAENEAQAVGRGLSRLHAIAPDLTNGAFEAIEASSLDAANALPAADSKQSAPSHLMDVFKALSREETETGPLASLSAAVAVKVVRSCTASIRGETATGNADQSARLLAATLEARGQDVHTVPDAKQNAETLFTGDVAKVLQILSPDAFGVLYSSYLAWIDDAESASRTYGDVMRAASSLQEGQRRFSAAEIVLRRTIGTQADISRAKDDVDDLAIQAAEGEGTDGSDNRVAESYLRLCLDTQGVLSPDATTGVMTLLSGALSQAVASLSGAEPSPMAERRATHLVQLIGSSASVNVAVLASSELYGQAFGSLFDLAFVLPHADRAETSSTVAARALWKSASLEVEDEAKVRSAARTRLASLILDTDASASPSSLVFVANVYADSTQAEDPSSILADIVPKDDWFTAKLQVILTGSGAPADLAALDPLVPQTASPASGSASGTYDSYGRTSLARAFEALLAWANMGREGTSDLSPYIPIMAVLGVLAQDERNLTSGSRGLYRRDVDMVYLDAVVGEVERLISYWAVTSANRLSPDWFSSASNGILRKLPGQKSDAVISVLQTLVNGSFGDAAVAHRAFRHVLASLLRAADLEGAVLDRWMGLAQSVYDTNTDVALAVIQVLSELQYESPRLQRFRNEVASNLSAVSTSAIAGKGLKLLRTLNAIAPSPESTSEFLPQQRAVFLMKTINGWLTSEDDSVDLPEELEARVAELYQHLCPIVQDVPGAHWESTFDLVSNNLEGASIDESGVRSLQYFTLCLLTRINGLASSNKALKAEWKERSKHLRLALELILDQETPTNRNEPRALVEGMVVALIGSSNVTPVSTDMRPKLFTLLSQGDLRVQRLAYALLSQVIAEDIPRLVVEVETSTTDLDEIHSLPKLPTELVGLLRGADLAGVASDAARRGTLFGWMLVFQHFEQASATLRASFIDQLRSEQLVTDNLIPLILQVLGISSTSQKPVEFSRFAVDEFHVATLEEMDEETEQALVAHLFYRALVNVPILVRNWYEACKDRQLSLAFSAAVTKQFSPVLIGHEFALLRDPTALQQLEDENLTVKVSSGAAEITASYMIDEQPMEIGVRLPPEFPLRSVEVKDLKRVGVPENKWRGWLLNVQQTITSRNGLILEALTLFKKNVALHFEGVVECAICYSIISMNDKTLPSKPCRTCKNRFHASCLYKWFNSSNSSTCPMCRSLF